MRPWHLLLTQAFVRRYLSLIVTLSHAQSAALRKSQKINNTCSQHCHYRRLFPPHFPPPRLLSHLNSSGAGTSGAVERSDNFFTSGLIESSFSSRWMRVLRKLVSKYVSCRPGLIGVIASSSVVLPNHPPMHGAKMPALLAIGADG